MLDSASTSPSMRPARASRGCAGCSRGADPSCRCRSTSPRAPRGAPRWPWSISHWIASVISSSPRPDGSIARDRLVDVVVEQVHADEREVRRRIGGLLDEPEHLALPRRSRRRRTGAGPRRARAGSARPAPPRRSVARDVSKRSTNSVRPCWSMLSPRYMTKSSSPRKSRRDEHAVREPERRVLRDVGDLHAEPRAVADRSHDLGAGVADDDADVVDAGRGHVLDAVEQDRLVGHRDELLGARVGDRPQPRAGAAGEDQALHAPR